MPCVRTFVLHKVKRAETGEKWINQYKHVRPLGRGSFGKVALYETPSHLVAVKVRRSRPHPSTPRDPFAAFATIARATTRRQ